MALSDCPDCWDTPCTCIRGFRGSKVYDYKLQKEKLEKQSEIIKVLKEALEQYRDGKALLVKPEKRHLYQPDTLEIDAFYLRSMSDYTHTLLAAKALAKVQEMESE